MNWLQLDDTLIPTSSRFFELPSTRALPGTIPAILSFVNDLLFVFRVLGQ